MSEHKLIINTDLFNLKEKKVFVKLHLGYTSQDDKHTGVVEKWVTSVENYPNKVFYYKDNEHAYEFGSIGEALDFCVSVGLNGYCASVVITADFNDNNIFFNYPTKEN